MTYGKQVETFVYHRLALSVAQARELGADLKAYDAGQFEQMVREMRRHVEENAEYVGHRFAEEARKIHYEETELRGIYGEASPDEAKALIEEGIAVHALPRLPEDGN